MLDWMKRRAPIARNQGQTHEEPAKRQGRIMAGKYLSLYNYLENRYANTVVLTFAQIEDLLGFALPDVASLRQDWWTNEDPGTALANYSDSWILASRTARPNLLAKTVVFERTQ